jgi:hypothetical protein
LKYVQGDEKVETDIGFRTIGEMALAIGDK